MSAAIRVLHIVNSLEPGGMENGVVNMANRLHGNGFEIGVCSLGIEGAFASRLKPGVKVTALNKPGGFSRKLIGQLAGEMKRARPCVVHTHNLGPLIYAALATQWGRSVPILHGEHSQLTPTEKSGKRLFQRRIFYTACRAVHTVSEMQREELAAMRLGARRLLAVVNGVDSRKFQPQDKASLRASMGIPADALLVGMSGRFGPFKGHAAAIDAIAALAPEIPSLHFLVVGDGGPSRDAVVARMKQPDVNGRVHWVGYRQDMDRIYPALDLLLVPSVNEGLSNAVLEAMACGVPVLANASCGNAEVIRHGQDGWVMDLSSPGRIADGIRQFHRDGQELVQMGVKARERVLQFFSLEAMAASYAALYGEIANRGQTALASAPLARD